MRVHVVSRWESFGQMFREKLAEVATVTWSHYTDTPDLEGYDLIVISAPESNLQMLLGNFNPSRMSHGVGLVLALNTQAANGGEIPRLWAGLEAVRLEYGADGVMSSSYPYQPDEICTILGGACQAHTRKPRDYCAPGTSTTGIG